MLTSCLPKLAITNVRNMQRVGPLGRGVCVCVCVCVLVVVAGGVWNVRSTRDICVLFRNWQVRHSLWLLGRLLDGVCNTVSRIHMPLVLIRIISDSSRLLPHASHDSVPWMRRERSGPLWQGPIQLGKPQSRFHLLFSVEGEIMGWGLCWHWTVLAWRRNDLGKIKFLLLSSPEHPI